MPLRPFGLPTFSIQSRFIAETVVMEGVKVASGAGPAVIERARCVHHPAMCSSSDCTAQALPKAGLDLDSVCPLSSSRHYRRLRWKSVATIPMTPTPPGRTSSKGYKAEDPDRPNSGLWMASPAKPSAKTSSCADALCSPILRRACLPVRH